MDRSTLYLRLSLISLAALFGYGVFVLVESSMTDAERRTTAIVDVGRKLESPDSNFNSRSTATAADRLASHAQ